MDWLASISILIILILFWKSLLIMVYVLGSTWQFVCMRYGYEVIVGIQVWFEIQM